MTKLVNDPREFVSQALAGYTAAQSGRVLAVPDAGVVRAAQAPEGQVAVVMGGGSGHFPAFAGWVGVGFGHGAVCGNIFSSPSAEQIMAVSKAASNGGGILFAPINYAGDILHFGAAAVKLREEGVDVRMRAVTDDIVSAPTEDYLDRRGIAGAFIVLKMACAAAEAGQSLDEVERVMVAANRATRSFGAAFGGCTLPGAKEPMFAIPPGRVAVGLGIHGEPGTAEAVCGTADQMADLLVDGLFEERPPEAGRRVAVLVNGLGATKYDELSIIYRRVAERLADAGMEPVAPVVGEQVTSLDMAGLSVSFTYLDDELETLWLAPADVASFTRGQPPLRASRASVPVGVAERPPVRPGSPGSAALAVELAAKIGLARDILAANEDRLGAIDAVAGDGDHGAQMVVGCTAAADAVAVVLPLGPGLGTVLAEAARAWSERAGGTSGALWGAGLEAAARELGDEVVPDAAGAVRAVRAFADGIVSRGGARAGDKTMVDSVLPFASALAARVEAGDGLAGAWRAAARAADAAAQATAAFSSKRGRSKLHGDRSIGTPDPGAASFALIVLGTG
ncbi:MAG: dihydroxyacetone kinase family protein [Bifidobacteriaceae bacterium]|jgi:dihydroxyacetone kinase|nr:dihydroxyacetone kinase family protein [Bifidobacteriaceae bacterium]